jgi:hypothetical protein
VGTRSAYGAVTGWAVATGAVRGSSSGSACVGASGLGALWAEAALAFASSTCFAPGIWATGAEGFASAATAEEVEGTATGAGGSEVSVGGV